MDRPLELCLKAWLPPSPQRVIRPKAGENNISPQPSGVERAEKRHVDYGPEIKMSTVTAVPAVRMASIISNSWRLIIVLRPRKV